jgi:hypothetical protein
VPLPDVPTVGVLYRRAINLCRSCVGLGWLAQETTWFILVGPLRSNTLRPVSSSRVLVLGLFVVGITNWSGEGVGPKSLGCLICMMSNPCNGCPSLPFIDARGWVQGER